MITLHSFTEAHRSWTRGQIPFRLLQDQAAVLWAYVDVPPFELPSDPVLITGEQIDALLALDVAESLYADLLGGDVHVCETEADLQQIQGCDFEWAAAHGGKWPCVCDTPIGWDDCRILQDASGDIEWALFLQVWNDAGGPVYYVPKHLWTAARVNEHMALSNAVWA